MLPFHREPTASNRTKKSQAVKLPHASLPATHPPHLTLSPQGGSSLGRSVPVWAFYLGVAMAKTEASEDATSHGVGEAADGSLKDLLL